MQRNCCHISLAFILKLLNFLQTFVALSIILYSSWMLIQWNHHIPINPPPSPLPSPSPLAPTPDFPLPPLFSPRLAIVTDHIHTISVNFAADAASGFEDELGLHFNSLKLPAPWFIYAFMGVGILMCCIALIGCIAAESVNGCCLCFYTLLITVILLLEAALVAFIAIDHRWEKDFPFDPTGQLDNFYTFCKDNADVCEWVGIAVVIIQALSLLLAMILRAMISSQKTDLDSEDSYDTTRGRIREPLLNSNSIQPPVLTKNESRGTHSDFWSSQIRQKYGLNSGERQNN